MINGLNLETSLPISYLANFTLPPHPHVSKQQAEHSLTGKCLVSRTDKGLIHSQHKAIASETSFDSDYNLCVTYSIIAQMLLGVFSDFISHTHKIFSGHYMVKS